MKPDITMKLEKSFKCHGGDLRYFSHESDATGTEMRFSLFLPEQAQSAKVPYIVFLSGLTCTEDNFTTKGMAYRQAAALGLAVLAPDTSPRGEDVPNDEAYDLGQGAGFYINATQAPWATHFQMEDYITQELLPAVEQHFPLDTTRRGISGHSMGGHGALTLFYKYPEMFRACSAFSPIVAPSQVPWGHKVFTAYLGSNQEIWLQHDACHLVGLASSTTHQKPILIHQGLSDQFLESQLKPELFQQACEAAGQSLSLHLVEGYDHSYFFIQSFIDEHLRFHARAFEC